MARIAVKLDNVPLGQVVTTLFRDIAKVPYAAAPDVIQDKSLVSLSLDCTEAELGGRISVYLGAFGLHVGEASGVYVITRSLVPVGQVPAVGKSLLLPAEASSLSGSGKPVEPPAAFWATYSPKWRDAAYLAGLAGVVVPAVRVSSAPRLGTEKNGPLVDAGDVMLFAGNKAEVRRAVAVVSKLDVQPHQLLVKATVYEVATTHSNSSALSIAATLLGASIGGGASSTGSGDAFFRLSTGNLSAVVNILSGDSRFKLVTSPSVLARSGTQAVLTSGSQVPVLGSVSYQGTGGSPVQSVQYRDSGVILKVRPVVRQATVDLELDQEVSNFVRTDSSPIASPTLNRRSLVSQLSVRSGDIVVLGGLGEAKDSHAHSGFFHGWLGTRTNEVDRSEIVIIVQVTDADASAPAAVGEDDDAPLASPVQGEKAISI